MVKNTIKNTLKKKHFITLKMCMPKYFKSKTQRVVNNNLDQHYELHYHKISILFLE